MTDKFQVTPLFGIPLYQSMIQTIDQDSIDFVKSTEYKRYPAEMMLATQRLTFAQRGIYWTIQDHIWFEIHEGGLSEDYIKDICKDAEDDDVNKVINLFFKKDGNLYYSKHASHFFNLISKSVIILSILGIEACNSNM